MYLLDTDTCIDVLRGVPNVVERLSHTDPVNCHVSTISSHELFSGLSKAKNPAAEAERVERFLQAVNELPFDHRDAEVAAMIRVELQKTGMSIGPYDLLIAGHALAHGFKLVTSNIREFQRVDGLTIESWR